ncbi:TetR/AcrR family transcriptional regulator [Rhodococcus sp. NPDC003382]|uniref:TetR/AcrR family transcriptional regulator n=1 Tax=Rhodococcus sp. HM1 TaxID=2937759 RepID=UPI00200B35D3|nr:TetR/AcrR family transcriptional regulator [Rhodococcus sp. HM1]MCK8669827.1 TetR/AcrR family transcriptional regulator [Rhodococcus sp. HM1]
MPSQTSNSLPDCDESVRTRLVRAADEEMRIQGTTAITMAAVAERAGVSRATAFRQLGNTSRMIILVGIHRARNHIARTREIIAAQPDILGKIEDVLVYTTRELPEDPVIRALVAQHSAAVLDEDIRSLTDEISGPVLLAGQAAGIIRTDIPVREMIDFLLEQTYLAAEYPDRSEKAARHRFRTFVAPALRPQPASDTTAGPPLHPNAELDRALSAAADAIATARDAAVRIRFRLEGIDERFGDR